MMIHEPLGHRLLSTTMKQEMAQNPRKRLTQFGTRRNNDDWDIETMAGKPITEMKGPL